jgi:predicted AAA+ superfamily ATPase
VHRIRLADLHGVDDQKARSNRTRAVRAGRSANNVLLTGARGTGKSLVKAVFNEFAARGCA